MRRRLVHQMTQLKQGQFSRHWQGRLSDHPLPTGNHAKGCRLHGGVRIRMHRMTRLMSMLRRVRRRQGVAHSTCRLCSTPPSATPRCPRRTASLAASAAGTVRPDLRVQQQAGLSAKLPVLPASPSNCSLIRATAGNCRCVTGLQMGIGCGTKPCCTPHHQSPTLTPGLCPIPTLSSTLSHLQPHT